MAVTLYTSRVVLNSLGISDFGLYNVVGGIVSIMGFLNAAMSNATQRYLSYDIGIGNFNKLQHTFNTTLIVHILISGIIFILGESVGVYYINNHLNFPPERQIAVNLVFQFSLFTLILNIIQVPYNSLILAREHMTVYAYMSILEAGLKLLTAMLLIFGKGDKLILYSILTFLVALVLRILYQIYCRKNFSESKFKFVFDRKYILELVNYSGWNLFGSLSVAGKNQGLNLILNIFYGTVINAAYGIAIQVQGAVNQFVGNFQMAVNPQIIKNYASGNRDQSLVLMNMSAKGSYFLMLFIICPIMINCNFILKMWLLKVPNYTLDFVRLSCIMLLIDTISGPFMTGVVATGKIKFYNIIIGGINLLVLPISYVLLKEGFKVNSVFYLLILYSIVSMFFRIFFVKKQYNFRISYFIKNVLIKILLVTIICAIVCYTIYPYVKENWTSFFVSTIFLFILISITIYFLGLNSNEKNKLYYFILNKFKR